SRPLLSSRAKLGSVCHADAAHVSFIKHHNSDCRFADRLLRGCQMLRIAEQQGTATILEELRNLIGMKCRIEGNGRASGRDNPEVRSDPTRMIIGQDRNACARLKSTFFQPAANALRHAPRFGISIAFHPVMPLNFQRNMVRPALSALAE